MNDMTIAENFVHTHLQDDSRGRGPEAMVEEACQLCERFTIISMDYIRETTTLLFRFSDTSLLLMTAQPTPNGGLGVTMKIGSDQDGEALEFMRQQDDMLMRQLLNITVH